MVENDGIAYRGFFLNKNSTVRYKVVNDLPLGRSVDEAVRMVDVLAYKEGHGEVCPENWQKGEMVVVATRAGLKEYFA